MVVESRGIDLLAKGSTDTFTNTFSGLNDLEAINGTYVDSNGVSHGFLRAPDRTITTINVERAGTGSGQGTSAYSINNFGVNAGVYTDSNNVNHSFVLSAKGVITTFDVTGAGTAPGRAPTLLISTISGRSRDTTLTRAT
jgi:hypothetical protein